MAYAVSRILQAVPTYFGVLTLIFLLLRVLPGDPARMMALEGNTSPEAIAAIRERLGLNVPVHEQYFRFITSAFGGDFGRSMVSGTPVIEETLEVMPKTVELMISGVLISVLVGIPLGILSALRVQRLPDRVSRVIALIGIAAPEFWTGMVLLVIFSVNLGWFPVIGGGSSGNESLLERLRLLILPAVTVGFRLTALMSRLTRSSMLDALAQDYVRTATAKGLSRPVVVAKHAVRNALTPIVTLIGLNVGHLLGGAIAVEVVFARPGIGKLLMESILQRDYTQVQGAMAVFTALVIVVNLLVDLLYGRLDPRVGGRQ